MKLLDSFVRGAVASDVRAGGGAHKADVALAYGEELLKIYADFGYVYVHVHVYRACEELLKIYADFGYSSNQYAQLYSLPAHSLTYLLTYARYSSNQYAQLYFLLFQLAITRKSTLPRAMQYIKLARTSRQTFLGEGVQCEDVQKFEAYIRTPESHQAYLAGV